MHLELQGKVPGDEAAVGSASQAQTRGWALSNPDASDGPSYNGVTGLPSSEGTWKTHRHNAGNTSHWLEPVMCPGLCAGRLGTVVRAWTDSGTAGEHVSGLCHKCYS